MNFAKVKDEPGYVRDMHSRAIICVDSSGLQAYKLQKKARLNQKNQLNELTDDVNQLKAEISEIKNLLINLLDK